MKKVTIVSSKREHENPAFQLRVMYNVIRDPNDNPIAFIQTSDKSDILWIYENGVFS